MNTANVVIHKAMFYTIAKTSRESGISPMGLLLNLYRKTTSDLIQRNVYVYPELWDVVSLVQQTRHFEAEPLLPALVAINTNEDGSYKDLDLYIATKFLTLFIATMRTRMDEAGAILKELGELELDDHYRGLYLHRMYNHIRLVGDFDEAVKYLHASHELFNRKGYKLDSAVVQIDLAAFLNRASRNTESLDMYLAIQPIIDTEGVEGLSVAIQTLISNAYMNMENHGKAQEGFKALLEREYVASNNEARVVTLMSLALSYKRQGDLELAQSYNRQAYDAAVGMASPLRINPLTRIANNFLLIGDVEQAFEWIRKVPHDHTFNTSNLTLEYYTCCCKAYYMAGDYYMARLYFDRAYRMSDNDSFKATFELILEAVQKFDPPLFTVDERYDMLTKAYELRKNLSFEREKSIFKTAEARMALQTEIATAKKQHEVDKLNISIAARERTIGDVAQALHDGLGQSLTTLALKVSMLPVHGLEAVPDVSNDIKSIATEVRSLAHTLSPSALQHFGIDGAIEKLVINIRSTNTVDVEYMKHGDVEAIPDDLALTLYRSTQSILQNALRHGSPTSIEIQLIVDDGEVELMVVDDGKGFDLDTFRPGIGLQDVLNRVDMNKGTVHFDTAVGNGTTVILNFPRENW